MGRLFGKVTGQYRLFLNYDRSVKEKFNENVDAHIRKADQNWPGLVDKKAK